MNVLTLTGFLMGITLTLKSHGADWQGPRVGLMTARTGLAFAELYAGGGLW